MSGMQVGLSEPALVDSRRPCRAPSGPSDGHDVRRPPPLSRRSENLRVVGFGIDARSGGPTAAATATIRNRGQDQRSQPRPDPARPATVLDPQVLRRYC